MKYVTGGGGGGGGGDRLLWNQVGEGVWVMRNVWGWVGMGRREG